MQKLTWNDGARTWTVTASDGTSTTARYVVVAVAGCLSKPSRLAFEGIEDFGGDLYWTSSYPHEDVDLSGKRVAVIGTGSSGLQTLTAIDPQVAHLTVFQLSPSFAIPAQAMLA